MVIQSYPPVLGGAQRQIQRLGPLLAARGVEVTVITRRPPATASRAAEPGLDVRRLRVPRQPALASAAYVAGGAVAVVRSRPDVIHVFDVLSPGTIGLICGALTGAPVVAKILSTGPGGDIDRLLHKPLGARRLGLGARRFAAFTTLAAEVEDELAARGVPQARMFRIPNGVDARHYRPGSAQERARERARLGIGEDRLVWLYCGRLAPVKRLDVLLEAFREVPGELLIVGDGPEEDRVRQRAAESGLAGRVHLLDTVPDTAPLYQAADAYVSASLTEGMSGSVLEAMSSGLPVVASPASGMSELVGPDTGVVASDPGVDALARALAALADQPDLRASLGARGRTLVQTRYSLEGTADLLVDLYERVAGQRRGRRNRRG